MAEVGQGKQWYLAVGERSIGPLTTELVLRGIRSGKVPNTAWACQVGATQWSAISSFGEFQEIANPEVEEPEAEPSSDHRGPARYGRSPISTASSISHSTGGEEPESDRYPSSVRPATSAHAYLSGEDSEAPYLVAASSETELLGRSGDDTSAAQDGSAAALLPYERVESTPPAAAEPARSAVEFATSADAILGLEYTGSSSIEGQPAGVDVTAGSLDGAGVEPVIHDELAIDITFDEEHDDQINWLERFQSYFLVGTEVELPDETLLLRSLKETPRSTFLHDEALWNLALCLAFGSDEVASSSAAAFFDAIGANRGDERIEWICRTLLSKGFMPSGIPRADGMRGIDMLRLACPGELRTVLEREAVD